MKKRLFILGNGFDLDLGLATRYSDYAKSQDFWPLKNDFGISRYLNEARDTDGWLDIELRLLEYATKKVENYSISLLEQNKKDFLLLKEGLWNYLFEEQKKSINKYSVAARVLAAIATNKEYITYSFNYTDLDHIAEELGILGIKCRYIHGSVNNNNIILGINQSADVCPGYDFLYKVFDPLYRSTELRHDILEADDVIIFGHSLGEVDYTYFRSFFKNLCREENTRKERKHVTIITKDDDSRISILRRLREMNDKEMELMIQNNDFIIICTDHCFERDEQSLEALLNHIRKPSVTYGIHVI